MPDYIPAADSDLLSWSINFDALIAGGFATYGLVVGDATAYNALHDAYVASLNAATNPATRTSVTIQTKNSDRAALVAKARDLVGIIQADPNTTDTHRAELGITVRDATPTTIGAPITKPVVNVEAIGNLQHLLRIRDEATPLSNAKPQGTQGAEVFVSYGDDEPAEVSAMSYVGTATRALFTVPHATARKHTTAWYKVRWISPRGETGPISDDVSASVAA